MKPTSTRDLAFHYRNRWTAPSGTQYWHSSPAAWDDIAVKTPGRRPRIYHSALGYKDAEMAAYVHIAVRENAHLQCTGITCTKQWGHAGEC